MVLVVDFLDSLLVFLALCAREFLIEKVLCLDFGNSVILAHALCNKLLVGVGNGYNLGVKVGVNGSEKLAVHPNLTKGGSLKQVHTAKEGGLTRARSTDNRNNLAVGNLGGNTLENLKLAEILIYVVNLKHEPSSSFRVI